MSEPNELTDFGDQTVSSKELANVLGISDDTVRGLKRKNIIPGKKAHGGKTAPLEFRLGECVRAFLNYRLSQSSSPDEANIDYATARILKIRAEAEEKQLRVKLIRGKLHRDVDVEAVVTDAFSELRAKLLNLPSSLCRDIAGLTDPIEIQEILMKSVVDALTALSDYKPEDYYVRNPTQPLLPYTDAEEQNNDTEDG